MISYLPLKWMPWICQFKIIPWSLYKPLKAQIRPKSALVKAGKTKSIRSYNVSYVAFIDLKSALANISGFIELWRNAHIPLTTFRLQCWWMIIVPVEICSVPASMSVQYVTSLTAPCPRCPGFPGQPRYNPEYLLMLIRGMYYWFEYAAWPWRTSACHRTTALSGNAVPA